VWGVAALGFPSEGRYKMAAKRVLLALVVAAGLGCGAAPGVSRAADQADYLPKKLRLCWVGIAGGTILEWDGEVLHYRVWNYVAETKDTRKRVKPTAAAWKAFWKKLDEARVWEWRDDGINHSLTDGDVWNLHIEYGDRRAYVSGANRYPSDTDVSERTKDTVPSKVFQKYWQAVEELVGK
jgi:hypothetical protein